MLIGEGDVEVRRRVHNLNLSAKVENSPWAMGVLPEKKAFSHHVPSTRRVEIFDSRLKLQLFPKTLTFN